MSADAARSAERKALEACDQALRNQSLSLSFLSQQTATSGNTEAAILLALEALPTGTSARRRPYIVEAEAALYKALLAHRQTRVFDQHAALTHAAFNRTGDRIVTSSYDDTARIWDVSGGTEIAVLKGHQGPVERAEFSPDGSRVITAARDGTARVWNATSGERLFVLQPVGDFPTAIFSPNGNRVLTAGANSNATLWDAQTGMKVLSVSSRTSGGMGDSRACFSPDGRSFATQGGKHIASIWNAKDGALTRTLQVGTYPYSLAFSPDGSRLLIGSWGPLSYGGSSGLWDLSTGTEIAKLVGHKSDTQLDGAIFSHDGRRVATVSIDGTARLWDCLTCSARSRPVSHWVMWPRMNAIRR
jgi:WD40 repeat protein